jgi:hypothetical protein
MLVTILGLLMVTLCLSVIMAATDNPMGIATKQTVTLYGPAYVGGTLLPAGAYKVTHEMQGTTHIMIFKQIGGKAEVKTTCTLVPLGEKATRTEQRFVENANNQKVLAELVFKGDTAKHVLAQ